MSLTSSLTTALGALNASQGGIQVTNNNIANANTAGYTEEVVDLQTAAPVQDGTVQLGGGVALQGYTSVRDELLQMQLQQQTSSQGSADAQTNAMQQIEPLFTTSSDDIGTEMSTLFSSLSALATDPTDTASRQAVLSAGQGLASAFNTASNTLTSQQVGLNTQVTQDVGQVNRLTQQIAALNPQIVASHQTDPAENGGTLQDQQDQLIQQLSALTNVQVTQTNNGVTLATGNGTPLVVGSQSYSLQTSTSADGSTQVLDQSGDNITSSLQGGDLGGTIQVRDQTIPNILGQLDTLANQVGTAFNSAQTSGFGQSGNAGTDFFNLPANVSGSAASISLALTDPTQVAASSDGTPGSSGNLADFAAIQTTALPGGSTPTNTYANLVYQVGNLSATATAESSATAASILQINNQISSESGVSIDQETTNLIKYQQSYQAAAQVVNVVNGLFTATMNMMNPTTA
ncbi:flagellar hook-associated protein FlgK [Granulicella sp. 5B5]|uniref:flagellar hook-associated protein FlgK n=1 Tax=Granulicella sp. 5B5 TaxID=1617967 RepID=UPI0015F473AA|nr:flagellar hook-associated protein FlgK [Granulicella sp. 5B5]QMV17505.1 flagellar hook-associated protein FlgK [Granulicella sp. 5B5]